MTDGGAARRAREDWTERIGRAGGETGHQAAGLPAPVGLSDVAGRARVSLSWLPVPGASPDRAGPA